MADAPTNPPGTLDRAAVLDRYFLEHRAKLLDLAAFLDRHDRAPGSDNSASGNTTDDPRLVALRGAIELLIDNHPHRTRRILEHLSDLSEELLDRAPGKGATGAPPIKNLKSEI